ncbi:unnamed protein product [Nesidiocoris tenuis]|uniref:Uncharacterized protein n=1 Tax=Nesidiocoris tenuis TaxID=355587 RepID=A0A6H5G8S7_9HEMI|nr:unnamed protein product [Nesidiocoris tenuis]
MFDWIKLELDEIVPISRNSFKATVELLKCFYYQNNTCMRQMTLLVDVRMPKAKLSNSASNLLGLLSC